MSLSLQKPQDYLNIDYDVNPWLKDYDLYNDCKFINNLLNIGYVVSKQLNIKSNDEELHKLLEQQNLINKKEIELFQQSNKALISQLSSRIDHLGSTINNNTSSTNNSIRQNFDKVHDIVKDITGKTNISAHKGQVGENYIQNILQTAYPKAMIESTVSEAHAADIHFKVQGKPQIYIESKFYSNTIPSKEIEKFKNDLERNNINLGIFISFKQKITGIYDKISIQKYGDKIVIFASQLEFNPSDIILPVEFALTLNKFSNQDITNLNDAIADKLPEIIKLTKHLDSVYTDFSRNLDTIKKHKKIIIDSLDEIYSNTVETYSKMKATIEDVKNNIVYNINELTDNSSIDEITNNPDFSECEEIPASIYTSINTILPASYKFAKCGDSFSLVKNNEVFVKFSDSKKKIRAKLNNGITVDITNKNIDVFLSLL